MRLLNPPESSIEGAVVRYAKSEGIESVKLNGMGKRSHPDRMFLYDGHVLFIEFKRRGELPTALQQALHRRWRALGYRVYVVDNVAAGRDLIYRFFKGTR